MTPDPKKSRTVSRKTQILTILWPTRMRQQLDTAVFAASAKEREAALMKLLADYTGQIEDPSSRRWVKVKP